MAGRHTTKQAKTINVMNNKLLVLLPASLISVAAFGGVSKDTVVVKSTPSVDTVVSKSSSIVKHNIASVKENVDTVVVTVGKRGLYVSEDLNGDVSVWTSKHKKKEKNFYSHLSGFGLGVNVYLNKDGAMKLPDQYKDMDLNVSKSINVVLNLFDVSQPLISNKLAITAGVGTEWHNYRFSEDITLVKENGILKTKALTGNVVKTKLTDWWLNVPVALELNGGRYNSFYASFGAVGSLLLNSHTKVVTRDGGKQKDKNWNAFYLNPFRVSLMAKVGYGNFGVYATYSLVQMFQEDKGPELYPFAAGVTLNF